MRKKFLLICFPSLFLFLFSVSAQAPVGFRAQTDLRKTDRDRLFVTMDVPKLNSSNAEFHFPKMVPGIYGELNFGLNIDSVWGIYSKNKRRLLPRKDTNSWIIPDANRLLRVEYFVNDDYDDLASYSGRMYKSARSIFTADTVFVINNNSVFGFIPGYEKRPYEITFKKPAHLTGSTSLTNTNTSDSVSSYTASFYAKLVDNPILFSVADTSVIQLDDVRVTVAVYSTSGKKVAATIAEKVAPLLRLQKAYLGGKLPVKTYNFLLYHFAASQPRPTFGEGLEHSASTVILLHMMMNEEEISRSVYGIASHEFLHTILPLALHSEEIENYDFSGPTMSKHLWLYEGMTEYFTMHIPVKGGAISYEDFFKTVEGKIAGMKEFDSTLSLTSLSKLAVQRQDQYMNVYLRGALVSLCLDIRLRELSGGKLGVQELIALLLKEYGVSKPFKDDELFDKIVTVSGYPEIREFIMKYIEGSHQPPLSEYFIKTGLKLGPDGKINIDSSASASQVSLRKQWLGGN